jgi:hypothetical protein
MLLKYGLGEVEAAERIESAVLETLNRGFRTADIYSAGTVSIYLVILILALKKPKLSFNCTLDYLKSLIIIMGGHRLKKRSWKHCLLHCDSYQIIA